MQTLVGCGGAVRIPPKFNIGGAKEGVGHNDMDPLAFFAGKGNLCRGARCVLG